MNEWDRALQERAEQPGPGARCPDAIILAVVVLACVIAAIGVAL